MEKNRVDEIVRRAREGLHFDSREILALAAEHDYFNRELNIVCEDRNILHTAVADLGRRNEQLVEALKHARTCVVALSGVTDAEHRQKERVVAFIDLALKGF